MTRTTLVRMAVLATLGVAIAGGGTLAYLKRARPTWNTAADGLAIAGYDPVTYFPDGGSRPRAGDPRFTAEHEGRRYRFASDANRARFLATPERFEPQFGGWCAYAVAHGYKFEVDPQSYLVSKDRLLLFYKGALGDARTVFEKEGVEAGLQQADANWPSLAAE